MAVSIPDEQAALLGAIVAHPDDDTARLVYADWLQENGDEEQATFIRDSIKLALMKPKGKTWRTLLEELRDTLAEYREEWCAPFGIGETALVVRYERGFPLRVICDCPDAFFEAAETWMTFIPIRGVEITHGASEFDNASLPRFAGSPVLARLNDLRLYGHPEIATHNWRKLFHSPNVAGLEHLSIMASRIMSSTMIELASSPTLANVTSLELSDNSIGTAGARAILESSHLTKLKNLWLGGCFFGEEPGENDVLAELVARLGDGLHMYESSAYSDDEEEELM